MTVSAHILVPGSRAMYSCDDRHRLSGSSVRECQEDGTWSEIEPTCEGSYDYGMIIYHDQLLLVDIRDTMTMPPNTPIPHPYHTC